MKNSLSSLFWDFYFRNLIKILFSVVCVCVQRSVSLPYTGHAGIYTYNYSSLLTDSWTKLSKQNFPTTFLKNNFRFHSDLEEMTYITKDMIGNIVNIVLIMN